MGDATPGASISGNILRLRMIIGADGTHVSALSYYAARPGYQLPCMYTQLPGPTRGTHRALAVYCPAHPASRPRNVHSAQARGRLAQQSIAVTLSRVTCSTKVHRGEAAGRLAD